MDQIYPFLRYSVRRIIIPGRKRQTGTKGVYLFIYTLYKDGNLVRTTNPYGPQCNNK